MALGPFVVGDLSPQWLKPLLQTRFKTGDVYQDELGMLGEIPDEAAWGWGRLSTELVEVHLVPSNHTTMLTEPHVQVLAEKLRECLDNCVLIVNC